MPLYTYRKSTAYAADDTTTNLFPAFENDIKLPGPVHKLMKIVGSKNVRGMLFSLFCITSGLGFIFLQIKPDLENHFYLSAQDVERGSVSLVDIEQSQSALISNPGADYFETITAVAKETPQDTESINYEGTFYLSIPSLDINRLPVTANVDSSTKDGYGPVLEKSLAHVKGTSLPFAAGANNMVIYGHSVGGSYNPSAWDVVSAFTFLPQLDVGEKIIVEMDGEEHTYVMERSKIVDPNDVSILENTDEELLTLFTCWPPGNSAHRYVATAKPV